MDHCKGDDLNLNRKVTIEEEDEPLTSNLCYQDEPTLLETLLGQKPDPFYI